MICKDIALTDINGSTHWCSRNMWWFCLCHTGATLAVRNMNSIPWCFHPSDNHPSPQWGSSSQITNTQNITHTHTQLYIYIYNFSIVYIVLVKQYRPSRLMGYSTPKKCWGLEEWWIFPALLQASSLPRSVPFHARRPARRPSGHGDVCGIWL